jgi:hypothetical protein
MFDKQAATSALPSTPNLEWTTESIYLTEEKKISKKVEVTCRGSNYLLRRNRMAAWRLRRRIPARLQDSAASGPRPSSRPRAATATSRAAPSSELIRVAPVKLGGRPRLEVSAVWDSPRRRPAGGGGNREAHESGRERKGNREFGIVAGKWARPDILMLVVTFFFIHDQI